MRRKARAGRESGAADSAAATMDSRASAARSAKERPPAARARQLASLADVEGVEAALYFDLDVPDERVDWRLSPEMQRVAGRLLR